MFIASSKWLDSFGHIYPVVFEWRTRIWRAAQQGIYSHAHHPVGSFYWKLRRLLDIGNAEQLILFFGFDALTLSFKVFHKMLVDGHERLESLYECLLTILANISPYIKSLSMITRYFSQPINTISPQRADSHKLFLLHINKPQYQTHEPIPLALTA